MKTTTVVVIAVMVAAFAIAVGGEVYTVGDSATWTNIGHVDYKTWASTKIFRVGDTIVFEYNKDFQNVARVTYTDFLTCNGTAPYATFNSGNDSFPIIYPGHYYFICTIPGHCESGQKVDIRVPVAAAHPALPPRSAPIQPLPFPYPPPSVPSHSPVNPPPSHLPSPAPSMPKSVPSHSPVKSPPSHLPSPSPSTPKAVPSHSPVKPPPSHLPSPSPSIPKVSPTSSQDTSAPEVAVAPPNSAPIQPLPFPYPPPHVPSPSPVNPPPSQLPSPAPSVPEVSPSSTPDIPSPEVAPAPPKNNASQSVNKVNLWATLVAVFLYLIGFSS